MSESSDGYSEDFDEDIHSDLDTRNSFHHHKGRQRTPALLLNKPEGHIQEMTMGVKNRQVGNRGANSLPILGRGSERVIEHSPKRFKKRMVSHEGRKPPNDRVLSSNLRTIRSLQSALKEKEILTEQLVKENKLYKRFDILAQKEVARIEKEHKNLPELLKRHETEMAIQKDRYRKVLKENSDIIRRKEHLEKELVHSKVKLAELKKISEDKKLEERHMLNQRLQEEVSRNQQLQSQLQEAERKLTFQDKSTKRERAELEDRCKKKEKRISLMEQNMKEIDSHMRTKRKQLEKLNIYSQRIEKNLPPNMNLSDLFIPQEDRSTMTSPSLLTHDQLIQEREEVPFTEQQYVIPSTLSHAHSSQSTTYTRGSYQVGQFRDMSPPTQLSQLTGLPNKQLYSTISPPMTHSEPGNYSESDMPTLQTSSGLTSVTSNPASLMKSPRHTSDVISPPTLALPDPPLSAIKEISISPTKPLTTSSSIPQTHTQITHHLSSNIPTQHSTHTGSETRPIEPSKKELLLQKLKQLDSKGSSPADSLTSTTYTHSARESDKQPDQLDTHTVRLRQQETSGSSATANESDATSSRGRKKKTFALDDLFSDSPQGSGSQLLGSSDMDPGLFSAPRPESPLFFSTDKHAQVPQQQGKYKQEGVPVFQQDTLSKTNHVVGEEAQEFGRKQSVVDNMFQGKPAYSTEDDFYGSKFRKTSPNKSSHPFQSGPESDRKPQHGRRARDTSSPPRPASKEGYYWENNVATSKPATQRAPPPVPVDDLDDDLEVIQL